MKYKLTIPGLLPGLNEYIDAERSHKGKYKAASMKRQAQNVIGYSKAKAENRIKLRKKYGPEIYNDTKEL